VSLASSHLAVSNGEIEMALKAGLHYYPDHLGSLYEQDRDHHNVWGGQRGCEELGRQEMWQIAEDCMNETGNDSMILVGGRSAEEPTLSLTLPPLFVAAAGETTDD